MGYLRSDIYNWMPISIPEIQDIFSKIPIHWCIAGGWALDLHLGKQTRKHSDVDIAITREQHLLAYQYLNQDWVLYKAEEGKLTLWQDQEYLHTTNDIWVSRSKDAPFVFQLMLLNTEGTTWKYNRNHLITRPVDELFLKTKEEIPYMRPEIQLLYKGGASQVREKDYLDFQTVLPSLSPKEKAWLKSSLNLQFPEGHDWISTLK
ncbi:nucleotidyltransferase domain-containing protein [Paenibacillus sp. PSB04]|uniref:nucleotidyltransferase domain-containing protein n=1 Tax=Paenibacillus sp. PSB04 TaxID=2866810 RepID=UPI00298E77A2|nr:hypothetical protein [Paenibacillus sp. PSB04]